MYLSAASRERESRLRLDDAASNVSSGALWSNILDEVLDKPFAFQDTMQADAITAVQELTGRRVVAFMSNNHIDPDLAVEVFILEPLAGDGPYARNVDGHGLGPNGYGPSA
jgi:hypothetical protein